MNERELIRIHVASTIAAALPALDAELDKMFETRLSQAFAEIAKGSLEPQVALAILVELRAYRQLKQKLAAKAREGEP